MTINHLNSTHLSWLLYYGSLVFEFQPSFYSLAQCYAGSHSDGLNLSTCLSVSLFTLLLASQCLILAHSPAHWRAPREVPSVGTVWLSLCLVFVFLKMFCVVFFFWIRLQWDIKLWDFFFYLIHRSHDSPAFWHLLCFWEVGWHCHYCFF